MPPGTDHGAVRPDDAGRQGGARISVDIAGNRKLGGRGAKRWDPGVRASSLLPPFRPEDVDVIGVVEL